MGELDRAAICARIQTAREQAGITQAELGEALDPPVHWRTIQTWESVREPRVPWDRLDELARLAGVTKEWLLHGEETIALPPEELAQLVRQVVREEVADVVSLLRQIEARLDEAGSPQAEPGRR